MYTSLYKMHQVSIHGLLRVVFDTLGPAPARAAGTAGQAALMRRSSSSNVTLACGCSYSSALERGAGAGCRDARSRPGGGNGAAAGRVARSAAARPDAMTVAGDGLAKHLSLLFVPAGVGVMQYAAQARDRMAADRRCARREHRARDRSDGAYVRSGWC